MHIVLFQFNLKLADVTGVHSTVHGIFIEKLFWAAVILFVVSYGTKRRRLHSMKSIGYVSSFCKYHVVCA